MRISIEFRKILLKLGKPKDKSKLMKIGKLFREVSAKKLNKNQRKNQWQHKGYILSRTIKIFKAQLSINRNLRSNHNRQERDLISRISCKI